MPREERQNSVLTGRQRGYFRGVGYDTSDAERMAKKRIRERTRNAFMDFQVLLQELPSDEREKIFDIEHGTDERHEFDQQLADTIQLIYAGLGGQSVFDRILKNAVRRGEHELGNVRSPSLVNVKFDTDYVTAPDMEAILTRFENDEEEQLTPAEADAFLRFAKETDGLDLDAITHAWKFNRDMEDMPPEPGWKRKGGIPWTPPEIYEAEGIDDMTSDELRERFPDVPYPHRAIYDGEKIYIPPWPGSDDDPTTLTQFEG